MTEEEFRGGPPQDDTANPALLAVEAAHAIAEARFKVRQALQPGRELSLVMTKLDEAEMWMLKGMDVAMVTP